MAGKNEKWNVWFTETNHYHAVVEARSEEEIVSRYLHNTPQQETGLPQRNPEVLAFRSQPLSTFA